jgi:hypothetical protein
VPEADMPANSLGARADRIPECRKKAQGILGLSRTLKLIRISLRELAKCLIGARLEGLRGRERDFLS